MSKQQPPLTKAATGSTICPGCNKRFANTPRPTVDIEGTEQDAPGRNSVGFVHRHTRHPVTRRWHADCLADHEASAAESRARAAADHEATMRAMCEETGVDYDALVAKMKDAS